MIFRIKGLGSQVDPDSITVKLRCPICHQKATFDALKLSDIQVLGIDDNVPRVFGIRKCPDPECGGQIFFVRDHSSKQLIASYPAERIDFDTTNVPATIVQSMQEAITCHANDCLTAAAIMVRKTLEELCSDRKATGKNLKERLKNLGTKIVLPQELLEGLDDLRLLGNDAAHIESQEFNQVGAEEVEIGI